MTSILYIQNILQIFHFYLLAHFKSFNFVAKKNREQAIDRFIKASFKCFMKQHIKHSFKQKVYSRARCFL